MASVLLNIEKGIEVAAEDALSFITGANAKVQTGGPGAIAGLGVLLGAVEKALADAAAVSANPASLTLTFGSDVKDIEAVWPASRRSWPRSE